MKYGIWVSFTEVCWRNPIYLLQWEEYH